MMKKSIQKKRLNEPFRKKLHEIIFEADTKAGKWFDIILIFSIVLSVIIVMLDSMKKDYGNYLTIFEWMFTLLFTIEYILRIYCVTKASNYMKSFYGIVDLLAILPTYLSYFIPGGQYLLVIKILRVLRIFRVFKLVQYLREAKLLMQSLKASRRKIIVFLFAVLTMVIIFGSMMYIIEGEKNGFTSIPRSIYWAIVTLTTVGYGDISPKTSIGQTLSALIMILGYSIIAVPTGIVSVEMSKAIDKQPTTQSCLNCSAEGHDSDADYCKYCGVKLN